MRFCPFCSAENADELAVCQSCGRRLPPLPPRRARNAPPTGVQLPPRPAVTTQPPPLPMRRAGATIPPAAAAGIAPGGPSPSAITGGAPGGPSPSAMTGGALGGPSPSAITGGAPGGPSPSASTGSPPGVSGPLPSGAPAHHTQIGPPLVAAHATAPLAPPPGPTHTQIGPPIAGPGAALHPTSGPLGPTHTQIGPPVGAPAGIHTLVGPPPIATPATGPGQATATSRPGPAVLATSVGFAPIALHGPSEAGLRAPAPVVPGSPRETIPGVPMPPPLASDEARALANALSPGPAAQRRDAPPPEPGDPTGIARRRSDSQSPLSPSGPRAIPSVTGAGPRPAPTTNPPPLGAAPSVGTAPSGPRPAPTTNPPPLGAAPSVGTAPSGPRPAPTTNPSPLATSSTATSLGTQPAAASPLAVSATSPTAAAPFAALATPAAAPPSAASPSALPPPAVRADLAADPPWATGYPRAPVGYIDPDLQASAQAVDANRRRLELTDPPPTRIHRAEALADRPFTPPTVSQVPAIPEPGLVSSARYAVRFAQARWQRRGAIKLLGADIKKDTDALDQVLGALGGAARTAKVDGRVFSGENAAITAAEQHAAQMAREHNDVDSRKLEENARFVEVERERNTKLGEAEHAVDEAQKELAALEGQRRALRDSRKELERRQKAYLKAAEDTEKQAGATETGEPRQDLRRSADQHRREAAAIEPERQEAERGLAAIERPIAEASAKLDAAKAELDAAKRSLADAREGHTHRLAELDAEQKRKAREIAQAEAEIARRLVTLGTLVNLNRIDDAQFAELYQRIDRLRGAITARTTEIEKLTAEREAYDRGSLVRGVAVIGGAILLFIALIVILRALLVR